MAETYSLAVTGLRADSQFTPKPLTLPDSACIGRQTVDVGRFGAASVTMQTGAQTLCKLNDGSFGWYTIDAERSTPSNIVLKAV